MPNEPRKVFELGDMRKLELMFLGPEVDPHNTICHEDAADLLSTFNFAYFEGDAPICYEGYPEQDKLSAIVSQLCDSLNVIYSIYPKNGELLLDLHPELRNTSLALPHPVLLPESEPYMKADYA